MITPIKTMTINQIVERKDDLLMSDDDIKEMAKNIRTKAIDEFAERLKNKILEEIDDVSKSQRNYEVGSDISTTYSHIIGTLRDVHHRVIDKIAEEMRGGCKDGI